jgi:hypothetical protein
MLIPQYQRIEMIQPVETRLTAAMPNEEYWRRQIKGQFACPVHTDARGYIRAIAAGDYEPRT